MRKKWPFFGVKDWEVETEKTALFEGSGIGTTQAEMTASPSESSSLHSFRE